MLAPLTVVVGMGIPGNGYYLSGTLIVLYAIVPFFVAFEGRRPTAREIAVVAVLTALAVAARAAFVWVPHFKPMAAIIMIAGIAAGPQTGFLVGSVAALASNFIFGQGPWTPWQMLAFGVAGLVAGLLADARVFPRANLSWPRRIALAVTGFVLIVGLAVAHSGYLHVLLPFHGSYAGAGSNGVPRRLARERDPRGGHGSHAAGCGEPAARSARSRACEIRLAQSVALALPNDDQEDN